MRLVFLALLVAFVATITATGQDNLSAAQILERMANTYATCKTYRDSGVVKTVFIQNNGQQNTAEKPFTTAFIRPDRFRYEFTDKSPNGPGSRYLVWRKGQDVQTWWDITPGIKKSESLGLALAGATGVSGSSAHTIPTLLIHREVAGTRLTDLTGAKKIEDGKLGAVDCYRIQGKTFNSDMTVWIDKAKFLVRRIDAQTPFDNFRTEQTTTYDPVIDGEVPEKLLQFDPPKLVTEAAR